MFLSGALEFPELVQREIVLEWAGKSLTQQLNAHAEQGWELIELRWLSDIEIMVIFKRPAQKPEDNSSEA